MIISNYTNTVKAWEERKKGIMWKLFSQEIRFKGDDESDFPEWEEKRLGEFCKTFSGEHQSRVKLAIMKMELFHSFVQVKSMTIKQNYILQKMV